jgi:GntR family transcriptional regulator
MSVVFDETFMQPSAGGPLYRRLQERIRTSVAEGRLRPNEALPPERDIAAGVGVSRVTVRKAIQALVSEGVIRQRHGSGNFVAEAANRVQMGLSHLKSFTEDMQSRGSATSSRWLERTLSTVSPDEAMQLRLSPGEPVARFHRLRLANAMPMAIERAAIPARILPDPAAVDTSLYKAMEAVGHRPVRALQRMTAANLAAGDAALLGVEPGAAALAILRLCFDSGGEAVELTRSLYRGDAYDFVAELTI